MSAGRYTTDAEPVDNRARLTVPEPWPEPPPPNPKVTVEPPVKLSVRDAQGVAIAEVIELGPLVLLRISDRDLALTPASAIKLAATLGMVAESVAGKR